MANDERKNGRKKKRTEWKKEEKRWTVANNEEKDKEGKTRTMQKQSRSDVEKAKEKDSRQEKLNYVRKN